MRTSDIRYQSEGRELVGYLACDDQLPGPRPGVLVAHEGPGLDGHAKGIAERLAGLGYLAFALDYNGGGTRLPMDQVTARLTELTGDPGQAGRLGLAGLEVLLAQEAADPARIAVMGYCFGAVLALELARTGADVKAVVGFHPGYTPPRVEASAKIRGSVLVCSGTDDPFATPTQRADFEAEMTQAKVADWRIELYGGIRHSFTNPAADTAGLPGLGYDAQADRRSWRSALALFDQVLGPAR